MVPDERHFVAWPFFPVDKIFITRTVIDVGQGSVRQSDPVPSQEYQDLFYWVYDDLRKVAGRMMAGEGRARTLQATALVHEAFLRFDRSAPQSWESRGHFFSAAVETMRRILIERARQRNTARCGGGRMPVNLEEIQVAENTPSEVLLAVDEALEKLAKVDPVKAEVVKLRFFTGCSISEVASLMGMAERTVKWHWTFARAWLFDALHQSEPNDSPQPRMETQDIEDIR